MSMFDGIEDAEVFERGVYFNGGFDGVVEITKTVQNRSRKGEDAFIVEMKIVEGGNDTDKIGMKRSWYVKVNDSFLGNLKAWAAAVLGYETSDKDGIAKDIAPSLSRWLEKAVNSPEKNAFIGRQVKLTTVPITTKEGRPFTRHDWAPAE